MSYQEELREHARIAILRMLEDAPKYTSNVSMMTDLLRRYGINYTRDQVVGQVHWLAEQGLVTLDEASPGFVVVTATVRGAEVAQGIVKMDGIQRPRPGV